VAKYALRRLWQMIPVLFVVSVIIFMIIHFIPGDPAELLAGPDAKPEQVDALRVKFGLDEPLLSQYFIWLKSALRGDLGTSYINGYPVVTYIIQRVPATLELALTAAIIALIISFPLGVVAALRPGSWVDFLCTLLSALSFALPGFWLAILFILFFAVHLGILPPGGRPDFASDPVAHLRALILPAITLAIGDAARLMRYLRSAMLEALNQDYTRTARGKGLAEKLVIVRHVLPNAMIPVVTIIGLQLGDLLSGAIIIETIFAWPGVGRLTMQAIGWRDYALLQANVLFIVIAFLLVNLLTDLTYAFFDPRIHYD
jgi:peptide/nickel transport system permease protein